MTGTDRNRPLTELLRLTPGAVDLADFDSADTPGFAGKKSDAAAATEALGPELADLQECLYANGRVWNGADRQVLVILQGMDTSGKGGVIRHAIGMVDPQGIRIKSFGVPTEEERRQHFLWRIEREVPPRGMIGIFDRSHYEDVLVVRVNELVPKSEWSRRYEEINTFEERLVADGTVLIKCFLHISAEEQKERLLARLEDPTKYWKYNPGDVDQRAKWPDYQQAYADALERCNTQYAPWYLVPSDRKWYRNWAVAQLLLEQLHAMNLEWPVADFDVEQERARVASS